MKTCLEMMATLRLTVMGNRVAWREEGQGTVEFLVAGLVLMMVFWGLGVPGDGALGELMQAMRGALTRFAARLALPV